MTSVAQPSDGLIDQNQGWDIYKPKKENTDALEVQVTGEFRLKTNCSKNNN
jgi:hypothetical protein